jgi:hypothetical protein
MLELQASAEGYICVWMEDMQRATPTALNEVMRTGARACIIDITRRAHRRHTHAVANPGNPVSSLRLIGAEAIVMGITRHRRRNRS